jgi:hypothetical protein
MPDLVEIGETARKFVKNEARNTFYCPPPSWFSNRCTYIYLWVLSNMPRANTAWHSTAQLGTVRQVSAFYEIQKFIILLTGVCH